ncbi:MAG: type II toxin-antitoxin system VapC family toxin [Desulfotignum sp.]|nr:type II toxin-antitoxin system VapC family toxin [Desulfotignum sp.]
MYILDTNTLIYFFKGAGNVADMLLSKSPKDIGIPAIVLFELALGIAKSTNPTKRKIQLDLLVSHVNIFPFGAKEAESAAMIRADLEKKGMPIGPYDTLIAGTALAANAILVTHNVREFERVSALTLEDWY